MVAGQERITIPDPARGTHPIEIGDHCGWEEEAAVLAGEAVVGILNQHRLAVLITVPGEAAPPVAVVPQAPDQASRWIGEDMVDLERVGLRIKDADVRLVRRFWIVGVGSIDPAFMQETTVEVFGAFGRGGGKELARFPVVCGDGCVGDRVELFFVSSSGLCRVR